MPVEIYLYDFVTWLDYVEGVQQGSNTAVHVTQRYLRLDWLG